MRAVSNTPLPKRNSIEAAQPLHLVHAAAFFRLLRTAPIGRIEDHSVARFQRRLPWHPTDHGRLPVDPHHASHQHAAMARRASLHNRLMIRAGEK